MDYYNQNLVLFQNQGYLGEKTELEPNSHSRVSCAVAHLAHHMLAQKH